MKNIALISLGGTISMLKNSSGLAHPALNSEDLIKMLGINHLNNIKILPISLNNVPGASISFGDLITLKERIKELEREGYDGVVIIQGTDTLEETSYFMSLISTYKIPIIFTGAQRNPSLPSSDAAINILDSLAVAIDNRSVNYGVLVVFNSDIHLARDVVKTHTSKFDTFKSLDFGPVGTVVENKVFWQRERIIFDDIFEIKKETNDVEVVYIGLFSKGNMIKYLIDKNIKGIILQSLGAGHVPQECTFSIKEAIDKDIIVIATSRCLSGRLFTETYGFQGSERDLKQLGVIFNDWLPTSKARIKLIVMLSAGLNYDEIKKGFEKNFYN
jgi:L-asparaginase